MFAYTPSFELFRIRNKNHDLHDFEENYRKAQCAAGNPSQCLQVKIMEVNLVIDILTHRHSREGNSHPYLKKGVNFFRFPLSQIADRAFSGFSEDDKAIARESVTQKKTFVYWATEDEIFQLSSHQLMSKYLRYRQRQLFTTALMFETLLSYPDEIGEVGEEVRRIVALSYIDGKNTTFKRLNSVVMNNINCKQDDCLGKRVASSEERDHFVAKNIIRSLAWVEKNDRDFVHAWYKSGKGLDYLVEQGVDLDVLAKKLFSPGRRAVQVQYHEKLMHLGLQVFPKVSDENKGLIVTMMLAKWKFTTKIGPETVSGLLDWFLEREQGDGELECTALLLHMNQSDEARDRLIRKVSDSDTHAKMVEKLILRVLKPQETIDAAKELGLGLMSAKGKKVKRQEMMGGLGL